MRATYPPNRLHNQHPPPPASESREQPNRAETGGSILDADSPAQGSKLHAETQGKGRDAGQEGRVAETRPFNFVEVW